MFKIQFQLFGCPEMIERVFQTREETNQFIGLHHECFSLLKVYEVFH